jgi:phosphate transport system substrate-binding protein
MKAERKEHGKDGTARKGDGTMRSTSKGGLGVLAAVVLATAGLAAATAGEAEKAEKPQGQAIQIEGSTTVGPIAEAFAEAFMKSHPGLTITVKMTGSGDGAAALLDGRCLIATMSRFMKPAEFQKAAEKGVIPCVHTIAMDGVCVILHPSNPVKALTRLQVRDIYSGKTTNWKDLGGQDLPIVAISRDTSSGTYEVFAEKVMGKEKMSDKVEYVNANPQAHARVKTTAGAIGYVGLGFVDNDVKAVTVDGVQATRKTIQAGVYPISRPLFLFTNGYPELGTTLHAFCSFFLTEKGQEIIEAKGFIPITNY